MWKKILFVLIVLLLAKVANASLPRLDLIKGSGPEVFVLEKGTRHWIPDIETFNQLNFKWENIKTYPDSVLENYPQDEDWSASNNYPDGSLLRGSDGKVYLIELGRRRWIPSPSIFTGNDFGWKYILEVNDNVIDRYSLGSNLTLNEPNRYPNTIIIEGPSQEEVLDTAEFEFRYSGTNPLGLASDLNFETYLKGYDSRWSDQGSNYIKNYNLTNQIGQSYTFYVRAKNRQSYYDPTPASWSFQLGLSPNYQKVEISNLEYDQTDFKEDYIVLRNVSDQNIDITGWTIRTKNASVEIPQAIKVLSSPFTSANKINLVLAPDDKLVAMSGISPSGVNFLTNKCTDYLDQGDYSPSLNNDSCPWPSSSNYSYLNTYCRDFINDLDRCKTADYSSNTDVGGDSECTSYLNNTFNYSACYTSYRLDPNFYKNEWRVFFGRTLRDIFSNVSDTVIIEDENGLKVDEYYYD